MNNPTGRMTVAGAFRILEMSIPVKTPTLPTHDAGSIISSLAGFAVAVFFAGGAWMLMR